MNLKLPILFVTSSALFAAIACSSGPSRTEEEWCAARQASQMSCYADSGITVPFDRAACGNAYQCGINAYSGAYLDELASCTTCSGCVDRAISKTGGGTGDSDKCVSKYAECKASMGKSPFDDDVCPALRVLKGHVASALVACLNSPCAQIEECMEGAVNTRGVGSCVDVD